MMRTNIPENWVDVSVEEITAPIDNALSTGPFGSSISSIFFQKEGIPVIRGGNLSCDTIIKLSDENLVFISEKKASEFQRSVVKSGDLIFTCWGTINQIGLIDKTAKFPKYVISNKQMKFTPDKKKANSLFLYYAFSGSKLQKTIAFSSIGSSIPGFNLTQLRSIRIQLPPLPEQTAIATALSDVDALISGLDRLIEKKRAIKQAAMQEILTGKRRLPGFDSGKGYKQTEVGVIPEDWDVNSLYQIADLITGSTPSTKNPAYYGNQYLFVSPADLGELKYILKTAKQLSHKGFAISRIYPAGSILFTCIGSTIGKCGIASIELTSNQQINAVLPISNVNNEFLYYELCHIAPKIKSLAGEQAVPIINKTQFGKTIIILPPLPEQTAIATVLSDMDAEISALETRRAKTISLKQGMMQELLTGRIRLV